MKTRWIVIERGEINFPRMPRFDAWGKRNESKVVIIAVAVASALLGAVAAARTWMI